MVSIILAEGHFIQDQLNVVLSEQIGHGARIAGHENQEQTGVGDQKNATSEAAKLERVVVVDHGRHTLDTR